MTGRTWIFGCVLALAGLGLVACDNGGSDPEDSGPGTDSGDTTDGGMPTVPTLGFGTDLAVLSPADFSCAGMAPTPDESGAAATFAPILTDFQTDMPVAGLDVDFFPDNVVADTCTGTCITQTVPAGGAVSVMDAEGSWYAYRVHAGAGSIAGMPDTTFLEVLHFNEVAPVGGAAADVMNAVTAATAENIYTLLSLTAEPGTASITGGLGDCAGNAIANARIRIFDNSGEIVLGLGRTGPRQFYFGAQFPARDQERTNVNALFGAGNVPVPSDGIVRVELWGATTDGAAEEMLGCEMIQVVADGISIVTIGPARADGPADCGSVP